MDTNTADQQVVIFQLATTSYAIDIAAVEEIIRPQPLTPVPLALPSVVGLISLRSRVVPVLDLRQRCGLPASEQTGATRIIVIQQGSQSVGLIVDGVSEVTTIPSEVIEPAVALVRSEREHRLLQGVARLEERLVLLLDLGQIVPQEERAALAELAVA